jgi:hypothetical protein
MNHEPVPSLDLTEDPGLRSELAGSPLTLGLLKQAFKFLARLCGRRNSTSMCRKHPLPCSNLQCRAAQGWSHGESRSYEDFLKGAELQEFIGGYVFDMPNWRNAGYTPAQRKLLDNLRTICGRDKRLRH